MRIARIRAVNFANFADLDIETGDSVVVVGENKVGKSNLLYGLRLLDPGLSERDRQLGLEHFWDGLGDEKLGATVQVSIDLTDFERDERLLAHLADCLVDPGPPMIARLTYRFQPKPDLEGPPTSPADYDYVMFGGDDPDRSVGPLLRRMLPLDALDALRDADKDSATWRYSPLRPLIQAVTQRLDPAARDAIIAQVISAQDQISQQQEVGEMAARLADRLTEMAGRQHGTDLSLGLPRRSLTLSCADCGCSSTQAPVALARPASERPISFSSPSRAWNWIDWWREVNGIILSSGCECVQRIDQQDPHAWGCFVRVTQQVVDDREEEALSLAAASPGGNDEVGALLEGQANGSLLMPVEGPVEEVFGEFAPVRMQQPGLQEIAQRGPFLEVRQALHIGAFDQGLPLKHAPEPRPQRWIARRDRQSGSEIAAERRVQPLPEAGRV
jgi:hypothetical protein